MSYIRINSPRCSRVSCTSLFGTEHKLDFRRECGMEDEGVLFLFPHLYM